MNQEAVNPYLPSYEYVPDGEPHVFGERVYVYGSHDKFNGNEFCMKDYVCWSASIYDLANWNYEGVIYRKEQDPRISDAKNRRIFAPDVAQGTDGRYYLYYAFDFSGTIAVAVCDEPAGTYDYYGCVHYPDGVNWGEKEGDFFQYDPAVLADKDNKVYIYSGFCPLGEAKSRFNLPKPAAEGCMAAELEADMLTIKSVTLDIIPNAEHTKGTSFEGHGFFEAPSIRRVRNLYYLIYSSEEGHELCYATSERANRDFRYGGVIISNGDIGYNGRREPLNYTGTNHGGIELINGSYYVFYHRQTNGNPYSRQGCAERIILLEDGSIPQVEMTSCGLNQKPLEKKDWYNSGIACCLLSKNGAAPYAAKTQISREHPYFTQDGEDRESRPGQYIANMQDGAMAGFKYFDMKDVSSIAVKIRGRGKGILKVCTDPQNTPFGNIVIMPSSDWKIASAEISLVTAKTAIWFCYEGSGSIDFEGFRFQ